MIFRQKVTKQIFDLLSLAFDQFFDGSTLGLLHHGSLFLLFFAQSLKFSLVLFGQLGKALFFHHHVRRDSIKLDFLCKILTNVTKTFQDNQPELCKDSL